MRTAGTRARTGRRRPALPEAVRGTGRAEWSRSCSSKALAPEGASAGVRAGLGRSPRMRTDIAPGGRAPAATATHPAGIHDGHTGRYRHETRDRDPPQPGRVGAGERDDEAVRPSPLASADGPLAGFSGALGGRLWDRRRRGQGHCGGVEEPNPGSLPHSSSGRPLRRARSPLVTGRQGRGPRPSRLALGTPGNRITLISRLVRGRLTASTVGLRARSRALGPMCYPAPTSIHVASPEVLAVFRDELEDGYGARLSP